jgi:hypothetical protein
MKSKNISDDFELIDILNTDGTFIDGLPKSLVRIPTIIDIDIQKIFCGRDAYNYINTITNLNLTTNNIKESSKINNVKCDTYTGYKGMNKENGRISDSYTFIENKNIDKTCFNNIEEFEQEILNINDKTVINPENQQTLMNKMIKIRNIQDTSVINEKDNTIEKLIETRDMKIQAIPKIRMSGQISSNNIINKRMTNYNFKK